MKRIATLTGLLTLLLSTSARAQAPSTMSYQGVLTDNLGAPVPDGDYDLTFRIYTTAVGPPPPDPVWTEVRPAVPVARGVFSVILGSLTPLALAFDAPYWLSVQLGVDPELAPRVPLASSPYSMSLRLPFIGTATDDEPLLAIQNNGNGDGIRTGSAGGTALYAEGNVHVTGNLTKAYTAGTFDLATPIAYGSISSAGGVLAGTPNVSSSVAANVYSILIVGEGYSTSGYVTTVTVVAPSAARFATASALGGQLQVRVFDLTGTLVASAFHFVTYKP